MNRDEYRAKRAYEDRLEYADMRREDMLIAREAARRGWCVDCQGAPATEVVQGYKVCDHCAAYRRGELC